MGTYDLDTVAPTIEPCPSVPGRSEGHGEGLVYKNRHYYYRTAKRIPKDKPVAVKWEGNWCGRQKGEVEHLILAWNGTDFTVLEHVYQGGLTKAMSKYKGMDHAAAVAERKAEMEKWRKMWEESPKCKHCGGNPITLLDGQPKGVCMCCFKKGLK